MANSVSISSSHQVAQDALNIVKSLAATAKSLVTRGHLGLARQAYLEAANICQTKGDQCIHADRYELLGRQESMLAAAAGVGSKSVREEGAGAVPAAPQSGVTAAANRPTLSPPFGLSAHSSTDRVPDRLPISSFDYQKEDYRRCVQYAANLVKQAMSTQDAARAAAMYTEAGDLLVWWSEKRFNSMGDVAKQALRLEGDKYLYEAKRLSLRSSFQAEANAELSRACNSSPTE